MQSPLILDRLDIIQDPYEYGAEDEMDAQ